MAFRNLYSDDATFKADDITIWPFGLNSIDPFISIGDTGITLLSAGGTWPIANLALFVPFWIARPFVAVEAFAWIDISSGNLDIGIYDANGQRETSLGTTASPGAGLRIFDLIPDITLPRGVHYLAMVADNIVIQLRRATVTTVQIIEASGMAQQAAALPLPANAILARIASNYIPAFGISGRVVL